MPPPVNAGVPEAEFDAFQQKKPLLRFVKSCADWLEGDEYLKLAKNRCRLVTGTGDAYGVTFTTYNTFMELFR